MEDTKTVEIAGRKVDVTVYPDDSARAEVVPPEPEAVLTSGIGAEVLLSDLEAADIRPSEDEDGLMVAYFNDEDRHENSGMQGNPTGDSSEYDRNWYFEEMTRPNDD